MATVPAAGAPVRVMSFNVKAFQGSKGGKPRAEVLTDVATTIRKENPDVIVLQEVWNQPAHGNLPDGEQTRQLAQRVGATDYEFGRAYFRPLGGAGQSVITRNGFRITDSPDGGNGMVTLRLPVIGQGQSRIAVVAPIDNPRGDDFTMIGTHLSVFGTHPKESRAAQFAALGEVVDDIHAGRPLPAGDPDQPHTLQSPSPAPSLSADTPAPDVPGTAGGQASAGAAAIKLPRTVFLAGDLNTGIGEINDRLRPEAHGLIDAFTEAGIPPGDKRRVTHQGGRQLDYAFIDDPVVVTGVRVVHPIPDASKEPPPGEEPENVSDHDAVVVDATLPVA